MYIQLDGDIARRDLNLNEYLNKGERPFEIGQRLLFMNVRIMHPELNQFPKSSCVSCTFRGYPQEKYERHDDEITLKLWDSTQKGKIQDDIIKQDENGSYITREHIRNDNKDTEIIVEKKSLAYYLGLTKGLEIIDIDSMPTCKALGNIAGEYKLPTDTLYVGDKSINVGLKEQGFHQF